MHFLKLYLTNAPFRLVLGRGNADMRVQELELYIKIIYRPIQHAETKLEASTSPIYKHNL